MSKSTQPQTITADGMVLPLCSVFRRFLKQQGLKFTPERAKILDAVIGKEGVFEAEELLDEMRHAGQRVSKATIYRTLKHLLESRIVREVVIDSRQSRFELAVGREPKAYLVCMETDRIEELDAPELTQLARSMAERYGFVPISHQFVVYGLSPQAQQQSGDEE